MFAADAEGGIACSWPAKPAVGTEKPREAHCMQKGVGIHAIEIGKRLEALEPVRQGVRAHCGGFGERVSHLSNATATAHRRTSKAGGLQ